MQQEIGNAQTRIAKLEGPIQATTDPQQQNALSAQRDSLIARLGVPANGKKRSTDAADVWQ